ncbi:hypothetical protein BBJ28_00005088 [Nothophytophthora sp. Chile5]|nr:hypothetical protein BBJ28_00005088 [Nothophytophthora sp. Chile5]
MAGRRGPQATYDQMMAEIQMESEDEEDQTPRPQAKRESGRRPASPPPARHHEQRCEGSDGEDKVVGNSRTTSREKDQRKEGKRASQEVSSSAASKDADSQGQCIPFPPSSSEKSRTQRRSNNSEGNASSDSDDSDHEREEASNQQDGELPAHNGAASHESPKCFHRWEAAQQLGAFHHLEPRVVCHTRTNESITLPSKTALEANVRNILTTVEFSYDEMGPGRLVVRIPQVQPNGAAVPWKENQAASSSQMQQKELLLLRNKRPHYDEKTGGHVLDFGGRVTMPSIKNFQMQADNHGDDSVLQFGRVSCQPPGPRVQCKCHKHIFTMDHPLSPLQGFAICLATLDTKFTDIKLYDNMSKLIKRK